MAEETQAIKAQETVAAPKEVESSVASPKSPELAALETVEAELLKVATERDNYRTGLLKAKGRLPDEDGAEEPDDRLRAIVREELLNTKEMQLSAQKDTIIKNMASELSEAKVALASRAQVSRGESGGGSEKPAVTTSKLSDDQRNDLLGRFMKVTKGDKDKAEKMLRDTEARM